MMVRGLFLLLVVLLRRGWLLGLWFRRGGAELVVVFARLTAVVLALAAEIKRPIKFSFPRDLLIQFGREALGKVFPLEQVMLDEALTGRPVVGVKSEADLQVGS